MISLRNSETDALWSTPMRHIIDEKWDRVRGFVKIHAGCHMMFLVLVSIYTTLATFRMNLSAICFFLTIINYAYELVQLYAEPTIYVQEFWNYVDFAGNLLFIIHCILIWSGVMQGQGGLLIGFTVLLLWARAIADLRAFSNTRYLVRLITEVFKDIPSFIIILIVIAYTFSICFYLVSPKGVGVSDDWIIGELKSMYRLTYGDFASVDDYVMLDWVFFVLSTILVPLVMMNLLIAIISDTFGRVYQMKEVSDYKETLSLILEIEYLLFWNRDVDELKYL